jgi:mono/diheme cytochrome c family protein
MIPRALLSGAGLIAAVVLGAPGAAWAQARNADFGKREYDANCAGCHGPKGWGDGPFKIYLAVTIPDIAVLASKNNGVFPYQRVYEVIDGRRDVAAHGPRTMPIWGPDYLAQAPLARMDIAYDPEAYVRARITALVDYIYRLQVK